MKISKLTYPFQGSFPKLAKREIHLWEWRLSPVPSGSLSLLSADERKRAQGMGSSRTRDTYVTCRATLRKILAQYLGLEPAKLEFKEGPEGKPELIGQREDLEFNLSHSGDRALLAVARGAPVGVDLETVDPNSTFLKVSERFFHPAEIALLSTAEDSAALFYQIWTAKEALIKAMGTGAFRALHALEVERGRDGRLRAKRVPHEYDGRRWELVELPNNSDGQAACLAYGAEKS